MSVQATKTGTLASEAAIRDSSVVERRQAKSEVAGSMPAPGCAAPDGWVVSNPASRRSIPEDQNG